jgi:ElaB/YqjD/DUF883 family membrane-anchored ribosome-binding protein
MIPSLDPAAELEGLQRDLQSLEHSGNVKQPGDPDYSAHADETAKELRRMLGEFQTTLAEAAKDAAAETEAVVASHPLISIASAFLAGVIVASLVRRI